MPVGIIGSLVICTVLYVLVSGAMIGLVPDQAMRGQAAPLVVAIEAAAHSPTAPATPGCAAGSGRGRARQFVAAPSILFRCFAMSSCVANHTPGLLFMCVMRRSSIATRERWPV